MATTIPEIRTSTEQKMLKSIESLKSNLAKVRTGRAHAGLLDQVHDPGAEVAHRLAA